MKRGPPPPQELIDAIRRCAELKMSMGATADKLTTPLHPLTRNTVAGIAARKGIKFFSAGARRSAKQVAKPVRTPLLPLRGATGAVVVMALRVAPRNTMFKCVWAGCTRETEPGKMLCMGCRRRPVLGVS